MIFKTIEDEANGTSIRVAEIFSKLKDYRDAIRAKPAITSSFAFDSDFTTSLNNDIAAIERYQNAVNIDKMSQVNALAVAFKDASTAVKEYAESTQFADINTKTYAINAKTLQVSTMAQSASLSNAKKMIDEYNTGLTRCGLQQVDYLNAIKQTNPQLAKYLSNVQAGNASVRGYVGSLIGAKAATIGLQIATAALNMALTMGISLLVSGLLKVISEAYVSADELSDKVNELTDK